MWIVFECEERRELAVAHHLSVMMNRYPSIRSDLGQGANSQMDISDIFRSSPAISVSALVASAVTAVGVLWRFILGLINFYDENLRKRNYKYYSFLLDQAKAKEHEDIRSFIESCKRELLFSSAFGEATSPSMAVGLMRLYQTRQLSLVELRAILPYSKLTADGSIEVIPSKWAKIFHGFGLAIFAFAILYLLAAYVVYFDTKDFTVLINGFSITFFLTIINAPASRKYIAMLRAKEKIAILKSQGGYPVQAVPDKQLLRGDPEASLVAAHPSRAKRTSRASIGKDSEEQNTDKNGMEKKAS